MEDITEWMEHGREELHGDLGVPSVILMFVVFVISTVLHCKGILP